MLPGQNKEIGMSHVTIFQRPMSHVTKTPKGPCHRVKFRSVGPSYCSQLTERGGADGRRGGGTRGEEGRGRRRGEGERRREVPAHRGAESTGRRRRPQSGGELRSSATERWGVQEGPDVHVDRERPGCGGTGRVYTTTDWSIRLDTW